MKQPITLTGYLLLVLALLNFVSESTHAGTSWTPGDITITVIKPLARGLSGNDLEVVVTVHTPLDIQSVKARVEGRETTLSFSACAYVRKECLSGWKGTVSLVGLPRGEKIVTITATDILGLFAQVYQSLVYDKPPSLTVSAPLSETVARPEIKIEASCADDDPSGCRSIKVTAGEAGTELQLATGSSTIEKTVSLKSYEGQRVTLHFKGLDSANQESKEVTRTVFVDSSLNLIELATVDGSILDVLPDRILFLDSSGLAPVLRIRDRVTSQETVLPTVSGKLPTEIGYLTPQGAIFVLKPESSGNSYAIYDWRNGEIVTLGVAYYSTALRVKGSYALWTGEPGEKRTDTVILYRRELVSGITATVAASNILANPRIGNVENDVSTTGDVVFWKGGPPYDILRYRDGSISQLTRDTNLWNLYPITDGINIVYLKKTPYGTDQTYRIAMYGESGESILSSGLSQEPSPRTDYQANGGWIAFTRPDNSGKLQVWTHSPSGDETQVSLFSSASRIGGLNPDGAVIFENASRLYLSPQKGSPIEIASNLAHAFWQNGDWFVTIGRTVFRVDPTASVPALDIQLSKSSYIDGDTVTATELRLKNLGPASVDARLRIWLKIPGIGEVTIASFDLSIPAKLNQNLGPVSFFTVTADFPRGTYELNTRLASLTTGKLLSEDINSFEIK